MMLLSTMYTTAEVWRLLRQIPDPEIPVISIIDLGIVRNVNVINESAGKAACLITITPTYSGCPAVDVIAGSIRSLLTQHGWASVELQTQLTPAWTTDWLNDEAKRKLRGYGIAPPGKNRVNSDALSRVPQNMPTVACPHCDSLRTRVVSQFGSTPCKALYRCMECAEPFDYFKCH
jgi:ring-1,2-phenylacetyl-CoA epoxidase subunit PaaD